LDLIVWTFSAVGVCSTLGLLEPCAFSFHLVDIVTVLALLPMHWKSNWFLEFWIGGDLAYAIGKFVSPVVLQLCGQLISSDFRIKRDIEKVRNKGALSYCNLWMIIKVINFHCSDWLFSLSIASHPLLSFAFDISFACSIKISVIYNFYVNNLFMRHCKIQSSFSILLHLWKFSYNFSWPNCTHALEKTELIFIPERIRDLGLINEANSITRIQNFQFVLILFSKLVLFELLIGLI
jgi:hypothetical protein